jgi:hypothetical protein
MGSAIARGAEHVGVGARAVGDRPEAKEEDARLVGDAPRRQMVGLRPHETDGTYPTRPIAGTWKAALPQAFRLRLA